MVVRKLPAQSERVETGTTQFGEDWPGVFIRGDSAFWYAMNLAEALKLLKENNLGHPIMTLACLEDLVGLFQSSNDGNRSEKDDKNPKDICRHRLVDARNEVVQDGFYCVDCGALFGAYHQPPKDAVYSLRNVEDAFFNYEDDSHKDALPVVSATKDRAWKKLKKYLEGIVTSHTLWNRPHHDRKI